jgi:hypothetical protein
MIPRAMLSDRFHMTIAECDIDGSAMIPPESVKYHPKKRLK